MVTTVVTASLKSPRITAQAGEGVSYVREGADFPGKEEEGHEQPEFIVCDVARGVHRRLCTESHGEQKLIGTYKNID